MEGLVPIEYRGGREEEETGWTGGKEVVGPRLDHGNWPTVGRGTKDESERCQR
jgi:hypothetical protein